MNLQLENKLALVSGSTAGIGFAIAGGPRGRKALALLSMAHRGGVNRTITSIDADDYCICPNQIVENRSNGGPLTTPPELLQNPTPVQ